MPAYMGNSGHLMQHWTLCGLVHIADEENVPGLSFIDAHAMAPLARRRRRRQDARFDRAHGNLPGQQSVYELAWNQLAQNGGYPNSAAFVNQVWTRDFSILLCEIDPATITVLNAWLSQVQGQPRCKRAEVFPGDWRDRFVNGLPNPSQVGLPNGSLTLVSFDPDKYYPQSPDDESERILYPRDLEITLDALRGVNDGVIIQLSTYSIGRKGRNDRVSQDQIISSADDILTRNRFMPAIVVRLDEIMMSLIYTRNVPWAAELENLPGRFTEWRDGL